MSDGEVDERTSKKRKATRACDRCNSQHQPCDNSLPKCGVCERAGTECTYDRPIRKRGPRVGYTSQNGERLWSVVLKARPELEDLVLQILRDGTYGDTGVGNVKFIKNNDNQTELVNFFNESRIGRFLQNGDSEDLRIPDKNQQFSVVPTSQLSAGQENGATSGGKGAQGSSGQVGFSNNQQGVFGPHGAPQNPGDIYLQSDEYRSRKLQIPNRPADEPATSQSAKMDSQPPRNAVSTNSIGGSADTNFWKGLEHLSYTPPPSNVRSTSRPEMPVLSKDDSQNLNVDQNPGGFELQGFEMSHWFDPIPTDTLLNLGFGGGDSMAQDFFELCENPDPVEKQTGISPATTNASHGEDEEEVWRRLVMRGRFM